MKNICITYRMTRANEIAETCITLPMTEGIAASILTQQGESAYVRADRYTVTPVKIILNQLAELQGYNSAAFCCAEERN